MKQSKKTKQRIAAGLLLIGLLGCSCAKSNTEAPELLTPVSIGENLAKAQYETIVRTDYETGYVAMQEEELTAPLDGTVEQLTVKPGDEVQKGDVLLVLSMKAEEEELSRLKEQLSYEKERAELVNRISEIEAKQQQSARQETVDSYQQALSEWEDQEAALALRQQKEEQQQTIAKLTEQIQTLEESLSKRTVVAPYDGIITWVYEEAVIGRSVTADTPLMILSDPTQLYVQIFSVESMDSTERYTYQTVDGTSTSELLFTPRHSVRRSRFENADLLYAQVGDQKYELVLPEADASGNIQSFYFADTDALPEVGVGVLIRAEDSATERILTIPSEAITTSQNTNYVYVVQGSDKILTEVEVGRTTAESTVEILSGLQEGDIVCIQSDNTVLTMADLTKVKTTSAELGEIRITQTGRGSSQYVTRAIVDSEIGGTAQILSRDLIDLNQITAGQTIMTLQVEAGNASELSARELSYRSAVQEADAADEQYDRLIAICERNIQSGVSEAALEKERLETEKALLRLKNDQTIQTLWESLQEYQKQFQNAYITAPCDGVLGSGGLYSDSSATQLSYGERVLTIHYAEKYVGMDTWFDSSFKTYCHPGAKVQITNYNTTFTVTAWSCYDYIQVDQGTSSQRELIRTQLLLQADDPSMLVETRSTMSVELLYLDQVLTVDEDAIYTDGSIRFVYVLEDGNLYRQHVVCGPSGDGRVAILAGLSEGQILVMP